MTDVKLWTQDAFQGGENDLLPPNAIAPTELVKLTNLLPGEQAAPLRVRGGTALWADLSNPAVTLLTESVSGVTALHTGDLQPSPTLNAAPFAVSIGLIRVSAQMWSYGSNFSPKVKFEAVNSATQIVVASCVVGVGTTANGWVNSRDFDLPAGSYYFRAYPYRDPAETLTQGWVNYLGTLTPKAPPLMGNNATVNYRISRVTPPQDEPLTALYRFSRRTATPLGTEFDFAATGRGVYRIIDGAAELKFYWDNQTQDTRFASLSNVCFAANGVNTPRAWDGDVAHAVIPGKESASTGNFIEISDRGDMSKAPLLKYMMPFRQRLWGIDGAGLVWFSGSSDSSDEILPYVPENGHLYYKRWQNWGGTLDSDGGYLDVGDDDGQRSTGLGFLYNGVVVFKERSIYLWSYGEAHPLDASSSSVEILVPGVGCSSHDTICYQDGAMLFLGQNAAGNYAVYKLQGQGIDDVSVKIPAALKRVIANGSTVPRATIYDHYYIIAADDRDSTDAKRTLVYVLDLKRNCWVEFSNWNVGAFSYSKERGTLLIGSCSDSSIVEYPSGYTDSGKEIAWTLRTRAIDAGNPMEDHRWRNAWVDVSASRQKIDLKTSFDGGEFVSNSRTIDFGGSDYWEDESGSDGSMWDDGSSWFAGSLQQRISLPLPNRSRVFQLEVNGASSEDTSIHRVAVAFRPRKVRC